MAAFIWTNSKNDALFLEFFDISIDITPVNANRISHFLSCDLRIILNQSYYFLLRFLLRFLLHHLWIALVVPFEGDTDTTIHFFNGWNRKSCRFESFKDFLITSSPRIDKTCFEKDICNILVPWTRRMLC